jgi:hypothetical protein
MEIRKKNLFFSLSCGLHTPHASGKKMYSIIFFNTSIFDQPCKDGPGQPGQDSQCRILGTGHQGQGM